MTALTETGLVNLALREIGAYRIEALNENSSEAAIARDVMPEAVRFCLSVHDWRFALKLEQLQRSNSFTPAARFSFAYQLPADFIRLGTVADNERMSPVLEDYDYTIAGGFVLASTEFLFCEYVHHHITYSTWPAWFTRYVTAVLASEMASPLKSTTERERLEALAKDRLGHARSVDSVQMPVKRPPMGRWQQAMMGGRR